MEGESDRRTLGDYFTLQRGTTYKSRLLGQPGPVLLGLATIQRNGGFRTDSLQTYGGDSPDKLLVRPGELYLSLKDVTQAADLLGAIARLPLDQPPGRLTQDTVKLVPKGADVPLDYLYWLLRTPQYRSYCRAHATGTTNLGLAREDFLAFPAPEPTPSQRRIVNTLGTLDDKIELNRRMNQTLEEMARAIFKSWFVDFDPVRMKAEGRDPDLPEHISDLFPDRFEDSELGAMPAGWDVRDIYYVAQVIYGAPFKSALFNNQGDGLPLIRIRDLATHAPTTFTPEQHPRGYLVQPGDLLVGMDGEFRPHLWRGPAAWLNQRVCCFKPTHGTPQAFVHYSIENLLDFFERSKTGTTVIHLGKNDIDTFRIVVPPKPTLQAFGAIADVLELRMVTAAQQSRTLAAIRGTLKFSDVLSLGAGPSTTSF
jgi:type I restriction enzyme S subunit